MKQINCPESLNQLIRNCYRLDKKIEQRIRNPYYDSGKKLQIEMRIDKKSPRLTFIIIPNRFEFKVGVRYINHIIKKLSNIYASLINQYKFRYQTVF